METSIMRRNGQLFVRVQNASNAWNCPVTIDRGIARVSTPGLEQVRKAIYRQRNSLLKALQGVRPDARKLQVYIGE